jgi:hypothetical protein
MWRAPTEAAVITEVQRLSIVCFLDFLPSLASLPSSPPTLPISPTTIDATVARAAQAFPVPGISVGILGL